MSKKLTIAIDGPAAAGKSTIAKIIAKKYGYTYIDTGAMYRSVAYYTKQRNIDWQDEKSVCSVLADMSLKMTPQSEVFLNGENVSELIRQNDISMGASCVSKYQAVREYCVELQRQMAKEGGVVLDGRDIGTVVLPNADLKIYQIASVEARAIRRHQQNIEKNIPSNLEEIKQEIEKRDYEDMNREISPLKKAEDAIELDTSNQTIDETVEKVCQMIEVKLC